MIKEGLGRSLSTAIFSFNNIYRITVFLFNFGWQCYWSSGNCCGFLWSNMGAIKGGKKFGPKERRKGTG